MDAVSCSIFFHNYYGEDHKWFSFFGKELTSPYNLFYNAVRTSYYRVNAPGILGNNLKQLSGPHLHQLFVRQSTNKGKDIGGKLVLMDAYLKLDTRSDYILLLHDKRSLYHNRGQQWQETLFRIAHKEVISKVHAIFRTQPQVGIVASESSIRNEADNDQQREDYTNSFFIKELKEQYGIHPPGLQYVAGTMFWVRASLFEDFFQQYDPMMIRSELEEGNVTDELPTKAHAWERLLCWMVTSKGFKIKGV